MRMTVTDKIIARAAGVERVTVRDFVNAGVNKLYIKDPRFSTKEDISAADGSGQTPLTFTGG